MIFCYMHDPLQQSINMQHPFDWHREKRKEPHYASLSLSLCFLTSFTPIRNGYIYAATLKDFPFCVALLICWKVMEHAWKPEWQIHAVWFCSTVTLTRGTQGERIQLHGGVWASKTMTSPIYPPQGGSREVWRIKLSPEIKRLLAHCCHGGSCANSPYIFQSCCILFDIISVDQGVVHSSQTHSPPKGNISLPNTDMIYADFKTWLCAILQVRRHSFLQVL